MSQIPYSETSAVTNRHLEALHHAQGLYKVLDALSCGLYAAYSFFAALVLSAATLISLGRYGSTLNLIWTRAMPAYRAGRSDNRPTTGGNKLISLVSRSRPRDHCLTSITLHRSGWTILPLRMKCEWTPMTGISYDTTLWISIFNWLQISKRLNHAHQSEIGRAHV